MEISSQQPVVASPGQHWAGLSLPLRECGEVAALRLASAFSEALTEAIDQLFVDAKEALTAHDREIAMKASELARTCRAGMVCDFMRHFETHYVKACEYRHDPLQGHNVGFDVKNLKIVDHHVLDDSLAPGMMAESIQNVCWHILQKLTAKFQGMLNAQSLSVGDLPLGPRVIERAVASAINDQVCRHDTKQRLERALRWGLASRVGQFYRDLADHLSAQDLRHHIAASSGAKTTHNSPTQASAEEPKNTAIQAAKAEITRCIEHVPMPQQASQFLHKHWQAYLGRLYNADADKRVAWDDAVSTMNDLAWSLCDKTDADALSQLKSAIPGLLKRLSTGMDALGLDQETRGNFYFFLTKQHAEVIKKATQCVQTLPAQALPEVAVMPPTQPIEPAPEELEATTPSASSQAEFNVISTEVATLPPDTSEQPEALAMTSLLATLSVGTWLEISEPGTASKELKLAWISPRKSLFLLTNRQGERALSLTSASLLALLNEGRAEVKHLAPQPNNTKTPSTAETAPLPLRKSA